MAEPPSWSLPVGLRYKSRSPSPSASRVGRRRIADYDLGRLLDLRGEGSVRIPRTLRPVHTPADPAQVAGRTGIFRKSTAGEGPMPEVGRGLAPVRPKSLGRVAMSNEPLASAGKVVLIEVEEAVEQAVRGGAVHAEVGP